MRDETEPALRVAQSREPVNVEGEHTVSTIFRFGLLELLLMTAAFAVWIPAFLAFRSIPQLEADIAVMQTATLDLSVKDTSQLTIRALPSISQQINVWKYYAPANATLDLRMATEGISSLGFPTDYQTISLPPGQHVVHLKRVSNDSGFHRAVYIDGERVLEKHHPSSWLESSSSTSTTDVENASQTFSLTDVIKLLDQRATPTHPLETGGFRTVQLNGDQDHKGLILWISPSNQEVEPAPSFISRQRRENQWTIGNRNGIRVRTSSERDAVGLLDIQPAVNAVSGEPLPGKDTRFGVSVRPIVQHHTEPEVPETQVPGEPDAEAVPVTLHATPIRPEPASGKMTSHLWSKHAISDDGSNMKVYAHFEKFPSGAQPIVEILFDADHPERIGFLPRNAPRSIPMQSCAFVTRFNSRYFWRTVLLRPDDQSGHETSGSQLHATALQELHFNSPTSKRMRFEEVRPGASQWLQVPFHRMPRSQSLLSGHRYRELTLLTDVPDVSKLKFPNGLIPRWQYRGIPNRQIWRLPAESENEPSASRIKVDIMPTDCFPATDLSLPGGPAVGNVRITVPMPATNPVWLSLEPDP